MIKVSPFISTGKKLSSIWLLTGLFLNSIILLPVIISPILAQVAVEKGDEINSTFGKQPAKNFQHNNQLEFIPNQGQLSYDNEHIGEVKYAFESNSIQGYLTNNQIIFPVQQLLNREMQQPKSVISETSLIEDYPSKDDDLDYYLQSFLLMEFENSNGKTTWQHKSKNQSTVNFYYANCPQGLADVNSYGGLTLNNLYNGIDVEFTDGKPGLKYNFLVQSGHDPKQIKMLWRNADSVMVDKFGTLKIFKGTQIIQERIPEVYQWLNDEKKLVKSKYVIEKVGTEINTFRIIIDLGDYNPKSDLIIDPWVTYFGGKGNEEENRITSDKEGNIYLYGNTTSLTGIAYNGFQDTIIGLNQNNYVAMFTFDGILKWSTYLGGDRFNEVGDAIGMPEGIVLGSYTSSFNYPVTTSVKWVSRSDCVITKLSKNGQMIWSTYFGGNGSELTLGICQDSEGFVYISGNTTSNNLPNSVVSGSVPPGSKIYLAKFRSNGLLIWSKFYGLGHPRKLAISNNDEIFIVGVTDNNGQATSGYRNTINGTHDGFVLKCDTSGNRIWSRYVGGSKMDQIFSASIDTTGGIYFCGTTQSADSIALNGWQQTFGGNEDGFLGRMNKDGKLLWCTYLGDTSDFEYINDVRTDELSNACIFSGNSRDSIFPSFGCRGVNSNTTDVQQFVGSIDEDGNPICLSMFESTFKNAFWHNRITLSGCRVFMSGQSRGGLGILQNAHQDTFAGNVDAYVLSINPYSCKENQIIPKIQFTTTPLTCAGMCNGTLDIVVKQDACGFYDSVYYRPQNGLSTKVSINDTFSRNKLCAQNSWVVLEAGCEWSDTVRFEVEKDIDTTLTIHLARDTSFCQGDSFRLEGEVDLPTSEYLWNTNELSPSINVSDSGIYWLQRSVKDCITRDSIHLAWLTPFIDLGADTFLCEGSGITLYATHNANRIIWNDGSNGDSINVNIEGIYSVTGYLANCEAIDDINITQRKKPTTKLIADTIICVVDSIQLVVSKEPTTLWFDGSTETTSWVKNTGTYWVYQENECGNQSDTMKLTSIECSGCHVFWPNSFSPNNDGINDHFLPTTDCVLTDFDLKIYNRWGELLFQSQNLTTIWNGKYRDTEVPMGLYLYKALYIQNGLSITASGFINVLK